MSRQGCRQAELWLAAVDAGQLDDASRIRLLDHLERCPACTRQAQAVSWITAVLRAEPIEPRAEQLDRVWRRVHYASAAAPRSRPARYALRWRLALAAGLGLAALTAALAIESGRSPTESVSFLRDAGRIRVLASRTPLRKDRISRWRATVLARARWLVPGAELRVERGGRAVLTSEAERIVLEEETRVELVTEESGTSVVRLHAGALAARTLDGGGSRAIVAAGRLRVRPLGTLYAVRWRAGAPAVEVAAGRVEVTGGGRRVVVSAGQTLRAGEAPTPLGDGRARELERALAAEEARALTPAPTSAASTPTPAVVPLDLGVELRAIERLLARGQTAAARSRIERLRALPQAGAREPTLTTLLAESFMRERRYARARDVYRQLALRHPRGRPGADALYMAATIELEQLGDARAAQTSLERYLARYPGGRQREGAYYLLCRALLQAGDAERASRAAARYLSEFPRGHYRSALERLRKPPP
jgi:hypothetical protein